jgi:hypothetical protein
MGLTHSRGVLEPIEGMSSSSLVALLDQRRSIGGHSPGHSNRRHFPGREEISRTAHRTLAAVMVLDGTS